MSLHSEYIKELRNEETIEKSGGFATYRFLERDGIKCVYILDIYVRPQFRKSSIASDMANEIVEIARKAGCKRVFGTVVPSANGSTISLKVLLGYGMTLHSCANDFIIFQKEIT